MSLMDTSPQAVASMTFKLVKRGYDVEEVRAYLTEVARQLESAQNQATAMEARARAALAKLQEVAQQQPPAPAPVQPMIDADQAEVISRTLMLAQRTADTTIAEAKTEAESILASAHGEAGSMIASARVQASRVVDEARVEARRTSEAERLKAESEVQALLARREFLLSDVEHLEEFVAAQRRRLTQTADLLLDIAERGEGGLGDLRRPLLSAAGEDAIRPGAAGAIAEATVVGETPPAGPAPAPELPAARGPGAAGLFGRLTAEAGGRADSAESSVDDAVPQWATSEPAAEAAPPPSAEDDTLVMAIPNAAEQLDDPTPVEIPAASGLDELDRDLSPGAPDGLRILGDDPR
jgi:DivIVA domain-containing protein